MKLIFKITIISIISVVGFLTLYSSLTIPTVTIFFDVYDQCNWKKLESISRIEFENNPSMLLPWNQDRLLEWNDFQGDVEEGNQIQACTYTWIFYDKKIKTNEKKSEFYFTDITANAYFRIHDSWVLESIFNKTKSEQNDILKHEQGHFDIAEEFNRKFVDIAKNELMNRTFSIPNNVSNPDSWADSKADELVTNVWNEHKQAKWNDVDIKYDDDVKGYFGFWNQWKYNDQFDKLRE